MNNLGIFDPASPEVNDTDEQTGKLLVETVVRPPATGVKPSVDIGKWSFHSRLVPENVSLLVNDTRYVKAPAEGGGWFGGPKKKKEDEAHKTVDLGSYEK